MQMQDLILQKPSKHPQRRLKQMPWSSLHKRILEAKVISIMQTNIPTLKRMRLSQQDQTQGLSMSV